jgi:hypothetical protein
MGSLLHTVRMGKQMDIGRKLLVRNVEFVAPKHIFLINQSVAKHIGILTSSAT